VPPPSIAVFISVSIPPPLCGKNNEGAALSNI